MLKYNDLRHLFRPVEDATHAALVDVCQQNAWLRVGGIPFEDDPFLELDSPYCFLATDRIGALEAYFAHGNWAIRNGVVFFGLAFINQVNGGDEWWTLKRFDGQWVPFESITFGSIVERGEFSDFLRRLLKSTEEKCCDLTY